MSPKTPNLADKVLTGFQNHIEKQFPFLKKASLIIACSGGLDSVVLTNLCHAMGLRLILAHCNFNLRGAESDADEDFVVALGKRLSIPVKTISFETEKEKSKRNESVQMTARTLRYEWFNTLVSEGVGEYVLTAHHLDDTLETFLINLSRGTGIQGLTGIPEKQGYVVRPLLQSSRKELLSYAKAQGLSWREDQSNQDTKYLRNQIRKDIVPALKEIRPDFLERFQDTLRHLQATFQIQESRVNHIREQLFQKEEHRVVITLNELVQLDSLESHAFLLFRPYGFTDSSELMKLFSAMSGKILYSETHELLKDREHLILQDRKRNPKNEYRIEEGVQFVNAPLSLNLVEIAEIGDSSSDIVFLDKEKLNYPLLLRKWKNGDYFYPLGMLGKKKVSKYFKDEKVDVFAKQEQWLLTSNGEIVWIIGRRMDRRFQVTENTQSIVRIELRR
ncbi:MAG: tRNA lysidine(34) synthetase TilS [Bacteroidota bacterium]